jgi:hypothetical protein
LLGVNYPIYSVGSNTTLRLAIPYTGSSGSFSYRIRRQFTTLPAWETCIDGSVACLFPVGGNLVNNDRSEGDRRKDSVFAWDTSIPSSPSTAHHGPHPHDHLDRGPGNRHRIEGGRDPDMGGAGTDDGVEVGRVRDRG